MVKFEHFNLVDLFKKLHADNLKRPNFVGIKRSNKKFFLELYIRYYNSAKRKLSAGDLGRVNKGIACVNEVILYKN